MQQGKIEKEETYAESVGEILAFRFFVEAGSFSFAAFLASISRADSRKSWLASMRESSTRCRVGRSVSSSDIWSVVKVGE